MHMPLYDYACPAHGDFRDWRAMRDSALPAPCPDCGAPAPRLVSSPSLRQVSPNVRIAHERNERSADSPRVMSRKELEAAHGKLGAEHHHDHHHASRNMYRRTMLGHTH
jgi:putative FmdB family regulatory protein